MPRLAAAPLVASLALVFLATPASAQELGRALDAPAVSVFEAPAPPIQPERLPGVARAFSYVGAAVLAGGLATGAGMLAYEIADADRCHRRPGPQACDPFFVGGVTGTATLLLALPGALALTAELLGEPVDLGWLYLALAVALVPSVAVGIAGVVEDDEGLLIQAWASALPVGATAGSLVGMLVGRRTRASGRASVAPNGLGLRGVF